MQQSSREKMIRRCEDLAHLMDSQFQVPAKRWRFGFDSIIGLIPGLGDLAGLVISFYFVYVALVLKLRGTVIAQMLFNVLFDWLLGLFPVLGDFADFVFKANTRNAALLRKHALLEAGQSTTKDTK